MKVVKFKNKFNLAGLMIYAVIAAFFINPFLSVIIIIALIFVYKKKKKDLSARFFGFARQLDDLQANPGAGGTESSLVDALTDSGMNKPPTLGKFFPTRILTGSKRLVRRKKYLQIALNSSLAEAEEIISALPVSDRILIEVGTPLIKIYGAAAIARIKALAPAGAYIVADNKCADLAAREVEMMAGAGANAATCLGVAPLETIDGFIEACKKFNLDSMIDMMNVESALVILKQLKKLPDVVMLHRGVDESEFSKEKQIPYYQIKQIKGSYRILVAAAGGDTIKEVQRAIFNGADIVVAWKNFYQAGAETAELAKLFLKEIK